MENYELSIIIPARNEEFVAITVQNLLENISERSEIIVVLDGSWVNPPIPQHPRVSVIYVPESIGQRGAIQLGARLSKARYIAKCDAHCSFDKDFDKKMIEMFEEVGDNVVMVPIMRNLHAFDWKCYKCGWKKYQGPTPEKCPDCGNTHRIRKKMLWIGKHNPQSWSYCFDAEPHFQYFEEYKHRPGIKEGRDKNGYTETMSLQGSFYMCTREKYWELNIDDARVGSWGSQGLMVACCFWLSGGRVLVNHRTWYAHMFRTQGGNFGFPYKQGGKHVSRTKTRVKELFWNKQYDKQIYPVSWLVERFYPVKGWDDKSLKELKENELK